MTYSVLILNLCLILIPALWIHPAAAWDQSNSSPAREERCGIRALKETFIFAAAREATGLVRSPWKRFLYEVSGGRFYGKELAPFFDHAPRALPPHVEPEQASRVLREINDALVGNGFPEKKLQNRGLFDHWEQVAATVSENLEVTRDRLSDFVVFDRGGQTAFVREGNRLQPVELRPDRPPARVPNVSIELQGPLALDEELGVQSYARTHAGPEFRVRRMTPATNDMRYPRDSLFEWEGELIARLRHNGARTVPNIQELVRAAVRRGTAINAAGEVSYDPEVFAVIQRAYELAFPGETAGFEREFRRYLDRSAYHMLVQRYLDREPELVERFLRSPAYADLADEFVDKHLAYLGATQLDIARGMLADQLLYEFETLHQGVTSPALSYSRRYMADIPSYSTRLRIGARAFVEGVPRDLRGLVTQLGDARPFPGTLARGPELQTAIERASAAVRTVQGQLARHPTHNVLTRMLGRMGLLTDERRSFPNNMIANFGLAKAKPEGIYTMSAFFDPARADGYLGPAIAGYRELPAFTPAATAPSDAAIETLLREIAGARTFTEQRDGIARHAPEIAAYLMRGERVPPEVREFASTLFGSEFAQTVYSKLGAVFDPNSINRFFPDGFRDFQKMNQYRYLFDLVHGLTTQLVRESQGSRLYLERALAGRWRPYDFSSVSPSTVHSSLGTILDTGRARIADLRNEATGVRTLAGTRDEIETWIGWDTYDMKFLRWKYRWDEWDAMGGGWNCVCFTRKSIFNPFTLKQF